MTKSRIPETDHGITGELTVNAYDEMLQNLRDKGWIETNAIIDSGIDHGCALEIGHGPGYLGLEWLSHTQNTRLTGFDISEDMHNLAMQNAQTYRLSDRTEYHMGNCDHLPFADQVFDAVFTNGSLHEWEDPCGAFGEIWRVLKPGGRYFISDLRRDMNVVIKAFLWLGTKPVAIRSGLISSINAAYTPVELRELCAKTPLCNGVVKGSAFGVVLNGQKPI